MRCIYPGLSSQFSSVAQPCPTLCDPMNRSMPASLSITNSWSPHKPMSIESVMPSNHLILCRSLLLPSIFPSIRVFSNESALHIRWPKYWSFSFNISPSNEHSGLISFRMDWLDLLAVQGTLKSLPQHHSSKASILQCSAFFILQLSHPYMTTGKTIVTLAELIPQRVACEPFAGLIHSGTATSFSICNGTDVFEFSPFSCFHVPIQSPPMCVLNTFKFMSPAQNPLPLSQFFLLNCLLGIFTWSHQTPHLTFKMSKTEFITFPAKSAPQAGFLSQ